MTRNDRTMLRHESPFGLAPVPGWAWTALCIVLAAGMAYLRLGVYPGEVVPLTDALVLMVCLLSRDVRVLWLLASAFSVMVAIKAGRLVDERNLPLHTPIVYAAMQMANIVLAAIVIHIAIRLTDRLGVAVLALERGNAELEASNEELAAREEEITQQNEELQSQAEQLEQQTEELNTQTEELQALNEQLAGRERTLGELLQSNAEGASEEETLSKLGRMIERLLEGRACGAAVLETTGANMVVRPLFGLQAGMQTIPRVRSLAEVIIGRDRAGFLADVTTRPDLDTPTLAEGGRPRSLAAAPLRVGDAVSGALEVYSMDPGEWTEHELRVTQWLAEQCGRAWHTSRLRRQLEDQRRLLRTVTDSSTVALFMIDRDGVCTYLNPAAERLTGYALHDLCSRPLGDVILPQDDEAPATFSVADAPEGTSDGVAPRFFVRKDGAKVAVAVSVSPARLEGKEVATVIEARDATEQRRHEEEREQLLESERVARAEAERANRAKDEFVATLSHELRTPLHAVMGWATLLRKNGCANIEEVQKGIEVIERNARHQSQLISDLLDISRITAGKIRLDVQPVDLPLVVESALESVRLAAEAKDVRLERILETIDRAVVGDPGRLQQVVWNLLSNAIKFTPRGGRVQVVVSRVASYVKISVSDTGEGIDPEQLPHLFERYKQGDASSTRRHGGLGLGLTIAKHLVELHGGSIHARSDGHGKGATFSVLLPVRAAHPATDELNDRHPTAMTPMPTLATFEGDAPTFEALQVLVVDDEEDARELIGRILGQRGALVRTAASGSEALDLLTQGMPDLLISDIGMPGMDGYAFIRAVRQKWSDSPRYLPAIALTAFARSEDRTRALLAGFQSHIAKPVEAAELVATVASLRQSLLPREDGGRA